MEGKNEMKKPAMPKIMMMLFSSLIVIMIAITTDMGSFIIEQKAHVMFASTDLSQTESKNEKLLARIQEEAKRQYIAPIDAEIDRVWKAVPGYNGLEVDIEASHKKTQLRGGGEDTPLELVYREIPPKVTLNKLPAQPTYKGNANKPMAAIMINVAWGEEHLESILTTLREEKVKATFFFDGSWVRKHPDLAKKIAGEGHEIGNHAYSHPNMSQLSEQMQRAEMVNTERYIKEATGMNSKWFAPPSGDFNSLTVRVAHEQGMRTVLWTVDTIDWQKPSPATIIQRVQKKVGAGSLILMHPTAPTSQALKGIIETARKRSLTLGTVTETLSEARIEQVKVE